MGNTTDMPELVVDLSAMSMNGCCYPGPRLHLCIAVDPGRVPVAASLRRDVGRLCDQQTCACTLGTILRRHGAWHAVPARAAPRERCHDDPVGKDQGTKADRIKQVDLSCL